MNLELLNLLAQLAAQAAQDAADFIRRHSGDQVAVEYKKGMNSQAASVVTWVDLQCQEIILRHLAESIDRYDLGLLTEESADDHSRLHKDYFWCIDPLDGTLAFAQRRPGYAVSIALLSRSGEPMIGVVHDPVSDQHVIAIKDQGITGDLLSAEPLDSTVLWCMLDRGMRHHGDMPSILRQIEILKKQLGLHDIKFLTGAGSVFQACRVARAQHALYFKLPKPQSGGGSIWDYAATACVFQELGLHLSTADGLALNLNNPNSTFMNHSGVVFATDPLLADAVIHRKS